MKRGWCGKSAAPECGEREGQGSADEGKEAGRDQGVEVKLKILYCVLRSTEATGMFLAKKSEKI